MSRNTIAEKVLYVDIDDTLLDTEMYVRSAFEKSGIQFNMTCSVFSYMGVEEYSSIFREAMSDYSRIPIKPGGLDALSILGTEFSIRFVSCYSYPEEAEAKRKFAGELGIPLILCRGTKAHVDMSGGYYIDDCPRFISESNAPRKNKFLFFNLPRVVDLMLSGKHFDCRVVSDWYDATNILMGVDERDAELREHIYQRIQKRRA